MGSPIVADVAGISRRWARIAPAGLAGVWLAATASDVARAGVTVHDTTGCLTFEAVDLELREAIGDDLADRFEIDVSIAGTEPRRLQIDVAEHGHDKSLWAKSLDVEQEDCSVLVELIGLSTERGLATLPGWGLQLRHRPPELGFAVGATLPWAVRLTIGADVWIPVRAAFHWDIAPETVWTAVQPLGASGGVQSYGLTVGTGPAVAVPLGQDALRFATRIGGGALVGVGRDADVNYTLVMPRVAWTTDVLYAARWGLRLGVRGEAPIIRLGYRDVVSNELVLREPRVRVGLVVMIAGRIRSSDASPTTRP